MFGQNNQHQQQDDAQIPDQAIEGALADVAQPELATDSVVIPSSTTWQHPGQPLDAPVPEATIDQTPATTANDDTASVTASEPDLSSSPTPVSEDLLTIKQQALGELTPLVDHLEQTPEEKFRTTMMMIQASDNQSLVHVAYEAALAIEDQKVKAQALLDVINEINYFTQQNQPAA